MVNEENPDKPFYERLLREGARDDEERFLRLAGRHGLLPLLSAESRRKWSGAALFLTGELLSLLERFERAGIPVVPYKGPVLAAMLYGDLSLREYVDLDLMVAQRDVPAARQLLVEAGYAPHHEFSAAQMAAVLRMRNEMSFLHRQTGGLVELQWRFTPRYFHFAFDFDRLLSRSTHVPLGGRQIATFSPEDLLLILCVHGAKHGWNQLNWVCDVVKLLDRGNLDWDYLRAESERLHMTRILRIGLSLAQEVSAVSLPMGLDPDPLVAELRRDWFVEPPPAFGLRKMIRLQLRMLDGNRPRLRYLARLVLEPKEADAAAAELPRPLWFLYYLVRPFRLLLDYLPAARRETR